VWRGMHVHIWEKSMTCHRASQAVTSVWCFSKVVQRHLSDDTVLP